MDEDKKEPKKTAGAPVKAVMAIAADALCALFLYLGLGTRIKGVLMGLLLLFALIAPIVGMALGLTAAIENKSKLSLALGIIAIALPVIAVVTVIILANCGVAIIRFM